MEPWEKELRAWVRRNYPAACPDGGWTDGVVAGARHLIDCNLLVPVEGPAECPSEDAEIAVADCSVGGKPYDPQVVLAEDPAAQHGGRDIKALKDNAGIDLRMIHSLQASMSAAEAEIKVLKEDFHATSGRIDGVIDRIDRLCKAGLGV